MRVCPFCGSATVKVVRKHMHRGGLNHPPAAYLTCTTCHARGSLCVGAGDVVAAAIARWNGELPNTSPALPLTCGKEVAE